jgi:hypothetical protein
LLALLASGFVGVGAEVERFRATPTNAQPATTNKREAITSPVFPFGLTRSRLLIVIALTGILLIAALSYALFLRKNSTSPLHSEIKSIAVLPLENLSGDPSQDYFADGMTDSLITDLSRRALCV